MKLVLALCGIIGVLGFAVQIASADDKPLPQQQFRIQKASDLIGKPVQNPDGERLGEVQDLAIDGERGRVAYVVLSFGGFLGMGEKWFAIPTESLTLPKSAKHFVLAMEKDRLKDAPGFNKDKWPAMGDSAWGIQTHKFYGVQPYWITEGDGSTPEKLHIEKASEIIGRSVQNDQGETLGKIKDLVIDPDRYRVSYSVLTFGGFLGLGNKLFAIPNGAMQMLNSEDYAVLTMDKDRLKDAPGFDEDKWPNLADETVAAGIYEFYGQKPYWTEDLRGGEYLASAALKKCTECGRKTVAVGFVRDGNVYCCAGCANKTGCTCRSETAKVRP
ncbi:MAG: PRC-barrel domain-containing protein [Planctomycetes bacterium]|nr:PRC-barrel domain-containing protein [Planctomycetota bacterium]